MNLAAFLLATFSEQYLEGVDSYVSYLCASCCPIELFCVLFADCTRVLQLNLLLGTYLTCRMHRNLGGFLHAQYVVSWSSPAAKDRERGKMERSYVLWGTLSFSLGLDALLLFFVAEERNFFSGQSSRPTALANPSCIE